MSEYSRIFRELYDTLEQNSIQAINQLNEKLELSANEFEKGILQSMIEEINRNREKYKANLSKCFVYFEQCKDIFKHSGWDYIGQTLQDSTDELESAIILAILDEFERTYNED